MPQPTMQMILDLMLVILAQGIPIGSGFSISPTFILGAIGGAIGYGLLNGKVDANTQGIGRLEQKVGDMSTEFTELSTPSRGSRGSCKRRVGDAGVTMTNKGRREAAAYVAGLGILFFLVLLQQWHRTIYVNALIVVWVIAVGMWTGDILRRFFARENGTPS